MADGRAEPEHLPSAPCHPVSLPRIKAPRFRSAPRRASVIGAGSFGTAVAVLLVRAGMRTTLLCRTEEQARAMQESRSNERYLKDVELPERLKIRALGGMDEQFARSDLIFVAVPSSGLSGAIEELVRQGGSPSAGVVSLAKGLVPPPRTPPSVALQAGFWAPRGGGGGGAPPARARAGPSAWRWSAGPRTRARWCSRARGSCVRRTRRRSRIRWPRLFAPPGSCARRRPTRWGWSWRAARRTPRRWPPARPRARA